MLITYIVSKYPSVSETFIAREISQLVALGQQVVICRLKPSQGDVLGAQIHGVNLVGNRFSLSGWFYGLYWALAYRRKELKLLGHDWWMAGGTFMDRLKLLAILLTTLGMAETLYKLPVKHIRANFLHSEAVSAYWLSVLLSIPYNITIHTRMIYFPVRLIRKVVNRAGFCVAISDDAFEFAKTLGAPSENIHLIRNGVNVSQFAINKYETGVPLLLAVGRLVSKKGFDTLIRACAVLERQGVEFSCRIIGGGAEMRTLRNLITDHNLDEVVVLCGALPFEDIRKYYATAAMLVMPSRHRKDDVDGLPTVLIEALASGLPVISTPVAGIPELVKHEYTGLLVPEDDEEILAQAILRLLNDKSLREFLGNHGRAEILMNYDIHKTAARLNSFL